MSYNLFVGSVPGDVKWEELFSCLSQKAKIKKLDLVPHAKKEHVNKGFAIAYVYSKKDYDFLIAYPPTIKGRLLKVMPYLTGEQRRKQKESLDRRRLFVSNLPKKCQDRELQIFFSGFGEVESAYRVVEESTRKPRDYGYLTFSDEAAAQLVLSKSPLLFKGANLIIDCFTKNKQSNQHHQSTNISNIASKSQACHLNMPYVQSDYRNSTTQKTNLPGLFQVVSQSNALSKQNPDDRSGFQPKNVTVTRLSTPGSTCQIITPAPTKNRSRVVEADEVNIPAVEDRRQRSVTSGPTQMESSIQTFKCLDPPELVPLRKAAIGHCYLFTRASLTNISLNHSKDNLSFRIEQIQTSRI